MEQQAEYKTSNQDSNPQNMPVIPEILLDNTAPAPKTIIPPVNKKADNNAEANNTNKDKELTAKQKILVRNYKGKGTLKKAAQAAGMDYSYARTAINFPHIQKAISAKDRSALCMATKRQSIELEQLITQEKHLAFSNLTQLFSQNSPSKHSPPTPLAPHELPPEIAMCIKRFQVIEVGYDKDNDVKLYKYTYELYDKGQSLNRLYKLNGMYQNKKTVDLNINSNSDLELELSARIRTIRNDL